VDRVDPDVVRRQLDRQGPHQPDDAVLRRDVVREVGKPVEAGRRGGDDDTAAAATGDHVGDDRFAALPHPGQVDIDHVPPLLVGQLPGATAPGETEDARIGQEDVDAAELAHGALGDCLHLGTVAHIGLHRHAATIQVLHQADCLLQVRRGGHRVGHRVDLRRDVADDDVGALPRQGQGVGTPLPASSTSDDCYFAVEFAHDCTPYFKLAPASTGREMPV